MNTERRLSKVETKLDAVCESIDNGFERIDGKVDKINTKFDSLESKYVTRYEFTPVKAIAYGIVGTVGLAVLGAIVALVVG